MDGNFGNWSANSSGQRVILEKPVADLRGKWEGAPSVNIRGGRIQNSGDCSNCLRSMPSQKAAKIMRCTEDSIYGMLRRLGVSVKETQDFFSRRTLARPFIPIPMKFSGGSIEVC